MVVSDATQTPVFNMRIAVEGCTHGELDKIYSTLQELETKQGYKVKFKVSATAVWTREIWDNALDLGMGVDVGVRHNNFNKCKLLWYLITKNALRLPQSRNGYAKTKGSQGY